MVFHYWKKAINSACSSNNCQWIFWEQLTYFGMQKYFYAYFLLWHIKYYKNIITSFSWFFIFSFFFLFFSIWEHWEWVAEGPLAHACFFTLWQRSIEGRGKKKPQIMFWYHSDPHRTPQRFSVTPPETFIHGSRNLYWSARLL